jgi:hypothetical protein
MNHINAITAHSQHLPEHSQKDNFLKQVETLFSEIKQWATNADLTVSSVEITIEEEAFGSYSTSKLLIKNKQGREIAQIIPIGASILGANGRIDIKGLYDSEIIVALNKDGPKMVTTIRDDNGNETGTKTKYFYKGIDEDGWYWIENKRDKGYRLNAQLFFELLSEISDYESN